MPNGDRWGGVAPWISRGTVTLGLACLIDASLGGWAPGTLLASAGLGVQLGALHGAALAIGFAVIGRLPGRTPWAVWSLGSSGLVGDIGHLAKQKLKWLLEQEN